MPSGTDLSSEFSTTPKLDGRVSNILNLRRNSFWLLGFYGTPLFEILRRRAELGVGEVRSSDETSNDRGAKGPWLKGSAGLTRGKRLAPWPSNVLKPRRIQTALNGSSEGKDGFYRVQER
jgi:hypothetical protein